jgi:hypothetical protein
MISQQTAIRTSTSALRVRPIAETTVAVDITASRSTSLRSPLRAAADQTRTLTTRVFDALGSWAHPSPFERLHHFCVATRSNSIRVCHQALEAAWKSYVTAHTFTLDNGMTVWVDEYQTMFFDATPCDEAPTLTQGSASEYDHWLEAQVFGC